MHAKSCDMTPYRLKLRMQAEADCESNSSEESWNVAAVDVQQENSSCQVCSRENASNSVKLDLHVPSKVLITP